MRKLLTFAITITLVFASSEKVYKNVVTSNKLIYTNPLDEKVVIIQNKENAEIISNTEFRHEPALFFSEYAEGSSNHKYLEIYNPTSETIDLSGYAFPNVSNAPSEAGVYEYWNTFDEGAFIAPGDVYVICHGSADDVIQGECDQHHTYLSNGDDGFALVQGTEGMGNFDAIDWIGDWAGDPGSGWEVCGTSNGTKDHTLVRIASVHAGSDWATSSNSETCEWIVYDQNTWDYLGSHDYDGSTDGGEPTCEDLGGFVDCEGQCVDVSYLSWQGDGYCDDGAYGLYLNCPDYNCDDGDCGDTLLDDGTCGVADSCDTDYDCEGVCGGDSFTDCAGDCVAGWLLGYQGDGWCDDGSWGVVLDCPEFNCDDGDCGNVLQDDGTCAPASCDDLGLNEDCDGNCFDDYYLGWLGDSWCDNGSPNLDCFTWSYDGCDCYDGTDTSSECYEAPEAANLFFSEASEGSSNNKYLEIYNASDDAVDLSEYSLSSCSNGCDEVGLWDYPDNVTFEPGTMLTVGDVYVVCHGSSDEAILMECDQTFTYLSNGDDVFALTQVGSGAVLDVIGLVGDDPGSGFDVAGVTAGTKDHTLVRKAEVTTGNPLWLDNPDTGEQGSAGDDADDSEWVVFDQNTWDYLGFHPHDFSTDVMGCMDSEACNYNPDATVDDGTCATVDCAGECGGSAVCEVAVTFSVDMSIQGVSGDVKVRTSTENGDYMPSDWFVMDDTDGDMVYTYTMMLETGVEYGYNFNDGGYESGDGLADCAGGTYGNDRYVTPGDTDMVLSTVCFGSCEACPAIVEGCTDDTATNYDPEATVDDGTCEYDEFEAANLFISEAAEGSSNNKYFEVYNASDDSVDLSNYAYPTVGNAPTVPGEPEYWNTFDEGAIVDAGDVYVVCHGSADEFILAECDEFYTYLSNGDDGLCLVAGSEANFAILDCVGDWNGDPGSGWDVAGVSSGTKDHTIVRKAEVTIGNAGYWEASAGSDADDSEWVVLDQNDWTYLGSHPHEFGDDCASGVFDCAGECDGTTVVDCAGECGGSAVEDCAGDCGGSAVEDCAGDCGGSAVEDCAGDCGGSAVEDCAGYCNGDSWVDCVGSCLDVYYLSYLGDGWCDDGAWGVDLVSCGDFNCDDGDCGTVLLDDGTCGEAPPECAYDGDVNADGNVNVTDIVLIVGAIINNDIDDSLYCSGDMNQDGYLNVTDIVFLVNTIIGGTARVGNATDATITIAGNELSVDGNGFIQGIQLTLTHDYDFAIELANEYVAEYATEGNVTTIVMVTDRSTSLNDIATTSGDYVIESAIVVDGSGLEVETIQMIEITTFELSAAYPNPFNPTTNLELALPEAGYVSVKIYNLVGQEVATLAEGTMEANTYSFTWDASSMSSGVYIVRAEGAGQVATQKLMLLK